MVLSLTAVIVSHADTNDVLVVAKPARLVTVPPELEEEEEELELELAPELVLELELELELLEELLLDVLLPEDVLHTSPVMSGTSIAPPFVSP